MRSVRLDDELESRLEETAKVSGQPVSAIIRDALRRRCDEVLGQRLDLRLADVIGVVASKGGSSRKTGREFAAVLAAKSRRKRAVGKARVRRGLGRRP